MQRVMHRGGEIRAAGRGNVRPGAARGELGERLDHVVGGLIIQDR